MDLAKVNWPWQMQGPTASLLPYSRGWPGVHERETDLGPLCTGSPSSFPQEAPDDDFRLIFLPVLVGRFGEGGWREALELLFEGVPGWDGPP